MEPKPIITMGHSSWRARAIYHSIKTPDVAKNLGVFNLTCPSLIDHFVFSSGSLPDERWPDAEMN